MLQLIYILSLIVTTIGVIGFAGICIDVLWSISTNIDERRKKKLLYKTMGWD